MIYYLSTSLYSCLVFAIATHDFIWTQYNIILGFSFSYWYFLLPYCLLLLPVSTCTHWVGVATKSKVPLGMNKVFWFWFWWSRTLCSIQLCVWLLYLLIVFSLLSSTSTLKIYIRCKDLLITNASLQSPAAKPAFFNYVTLHWIYKPALSVNF